MTARKPGPEAPLDPAVAATLAAALDPTTPEPARARALRERILSAASAPEGTTDATGLAFVGTLERRWEKRRLGVEFCLLHEDEHSRSFLLRLAPGGVLPAHRHDMDEESLLLEGDAWLGDIRYLTAGDYHFVPRGTPHPDLRSPNGCIAFVRGERRFKPRITGSLIARLARSLLSRD
ncbi:MAG: cupin domain-containing protein [Gammaproteobacteria bacterium]